MFPGKDGKTMKKAVKTRWLSHEAAVKAVVLEFVPVLNSLQHFADESDPMAIGLLKKMHNFNFISKIYILNSVLPILAELSRKFQKGEFCFSEIKPAVKTTLSKLDNVLETKQPLKSLFEKIESDETFRELIVGDCEQTRKNAENFLKLYIKSLRKNIKRRFGTGKNTFVAKLCFV